MTARTRGIAIALLALALLGGCGEPASSEEGPPADAPAPVFPSCTISGDDGIPADRVAALQRVADDVLLARLHDDYPLPVDLRREPFTVRVVREGSAAGPQTFVLGGDAAQERTALRRVLCGAYLARGLRDLPVHDWFTAGFVETLSRERGATLDPPPDDGWRGGLSTTALEDILTARSVWDGASEAGGDARTAAAFFAYLRRHDDPAVRAAPTRYFASFVDWATRNARDDATASDDVAARVLARKRRDKPSQGALRAAFGPLDIEALVRDWLATEGPTPR